MLGGERLRYPPFHLIIKVFGDEHWDRKHAPAESARETGVWVVERVLGRASRVVLHHTGVNTANFGNQHKPRHLSELAQFESTSHGDQIKMVWLEVDISLDLETV